VSGGNQAQSALPPDAVVIRGGKDMTITTLASGFDNYCQKRREHGLSDEYAISVNSLPGVTLQELAMVAKLPNSSVTPTTVGAVEEAGFEVIPTPTTNPSHCSVFLQGIHSAAPTLSQLVRLQGAFGQPIENPAAASRNQ